MRTREEQIADVFPGFYAEDAEATVTKGDLRSMLEQAERRAEQRVQAEIGRDSERLDWLEKTSVNVEDLNIHCLMSNAGETSFGICGTGNYEETLRKAIDAARENAND